MFSRGLTFKLRSLYAQVDAVSDVSREVVAEHFHNRMACVAPSPLGSMCNTVYSMKRRCNILIWAGFAFVIAALVSYIPVFALFPVTRDVPWVNYLLFLVGGFLLAVGIMRAFRDPEHYRGKISGSYSLG